MEQNSEDPGQPVQEPHAASVPIDGDRFQIDGILDDSIVVYRALLQADRDFNDTIVCEVPAPVARTQPIPTPGHWWRPRTRPIPLKEPTVEKRCWSIGRIFDAKATTPQELFIATDGTLYCSFVNGTGVRYVEVTSDFLRAQSGTLRIFIGAELTSKQSQLLGEPADPYQEDPSD